MSQQCSSNQNLENILQLLYLGKQCVETTYPQVTKTSCIEPGINPGLPSYRQSRRWSAECALDSPCLSVGPSCHSLLCSHPGSTQLSSTSLTHENNFLSTGNTFDIRRITERGNRSRKNIKKWRNLWGRLKKKER